MAKPTLRGVSSGVLVALIVGLLLNQGLQAMGAGSPADKPFAAASKTQRFAPGTNATLLTATVKNSKPTDLILQISLECSILTDNVIPGSTTPGTTQSASTSGDVRVWVEVDNVIVPIISSSSPPQNPPAAGNNSDKVTFCNRVFNRTVSDRENPQDGIDGSRDFIDTKEANAFNWVRLNMGSATHTIVVKADLVTNATPGSTASAYVGNRSLVGIPGKFANDAVIADPATG